MKNKMTVTRADSRLSPKWLSCGALFAVLVACGGTSGAPTFAERGDFLLAEEDTAAATADDADLFTDEAAANTAASVAAPSQICQPSDGDDSSGDDVESDGDDVESDGDDDVESDGDDVDDGDDIDDVESDGDDVDDEVESDGDDESDDDASSGDDVESTGDDCVPAPAAPAAADAEIE